MRVPTLSAAAAGALCLAVAAALPAGAAGRGHHHPKPHPRPPAATKFAAGQLQAAKVGSSGCSTNQAGEPSIHVSQAGLVALASENGLGNGSEFWSGTQTGGSTAANPCALTYDGQPNAFGHLGASGGDVDVAIAPVADPASHHYRIYIASLNLASVNVATSVDDGKTLSQVPVVEASPSMTASGSRRTARQLPAQLPDVLSGNIDVLRSDNGGQSFVQESQAIGHDYSGKQRDGQPGHRSPSHLLEAGRLLGLPGYVAQHSSSVERRCNEAFLAVSKDGGATWADRPIPCTPPSAPTGSTTTSPTFPWRPTARCSTPSATTRPSTSPCRPGPRHDVDVLSAGEHRHAQAIFPWIVATSAGEDLVYYGATGTRRQPAWYGVLRAEPHRERDRLGDDAG